MESWGQDFMALGAHETLLLVVSVFLFANGVMQLMNRRKFWVRAVTSTIVMVLLGLLGGLIYTTAFTQGYNAGVANRL